jgi:hypothetical protein
LIKEAVRAASSSPQKNLKGLNQMTQWRSAKHAPNFHAAQRLPALPPAVVSEAKPSQSNVAIHDIAPQKSELTDSRRKMMTAQNND